MNDSIMKKKWCKDETYSGSRYPGVPLTTVLMWVWFPFSSSNPIFDRPKSATLATRFFVRRMLLLLISRWIILGEHPVCRYSSPGTSDHPAKISISHLFNPLVHEVDFQYRQAHNLHQQIFNQDVRGCSNKHTTCRLQTDFESGSPVEKTPLSCKTRFRNRHVRDLLHVS